MTKKLKLDIDTPGPVTMPQITKNPDGSLNPMALALMEIAAKFCASSGFRRELSAFGVTCVKHNICGDTLGNLFATGVNAQVENCMAAVLAVNTKLWKPDLIHIFSSSDDITLDTKDVVTALCQDLEGFDRFYQFFVDRKTEIDFLVIGIAESMGFAPHAPEPAFAVVNPRRDYN